MDNPLINPGIGLVFWMLLIFGLLLFLLAKFTWPTILKMLKERELSIQEALDVAEKTHKEMEALQMDNKALLKEAQDERDELLRNARMASEKIIEEAKNKANQEIERMWEVAHENIQYEKLQVIHELKNEVANLSISIAEKIIKQELADKAKAKAIIDHEIADMSF